MRHRVMSRGTRTVRSGKITVVQSGPKTISGWKVDTRDETGRRKVSAVGLCRKFLTVSVVQ